MSMLRGAESRNASDDPSAVGQHADQSPRYLTDGVDLYRCLGAVPGGMGEMIGLENCRSLDVVLLPVGELNSRRLRAVIPAG